MKNLAGHNYADAEVVNELLLAGIEIIPQLRSDSEVKTAFRGKLNGWDFCRAWRYWVAYPLHPNKGLDIAKAQLLFNTHASEARAGGDCACRPPETWSSYYQVLSGKKIILDPKGEEFASITSFNLPTDDYVFVPSLIHAGHYQQVVDMYHIDTQAALNAFVEAIEETRTIEQQATNGMLAKSHLGCE